MSKRPGAKRCIAVAAALITTLALIAAQPNASAAPASCLSNGSGGKFVDVKNQTFTDSRGIASKYHLYGSGLTKSPIGLVVYFHGDGGYPFNSSSELNGIAKTTKAQGMMLLPLLTPDSGTKTWYEKGASNAQWVDSFLATIYKNYNVDRSRIWFVGYSGGSTFLGGHYITGAHMKTVCGGGSIMFGGGERFGSKGGAFDPAFVKNFRMHWYTGQKDTGSGTDGWNALKAAQNGHNAFKKLGFTTTIESPAGVGHNDIPFDKIVKQQLSLAPKSTATAAPPSQPKLLVSAEQGIVVVKGTGYSPTARVNVKATMSSAAGTKQTTPTTGGEFTVKFKPPAGSTGLVKVDAVSGNVAKAGSVNI